MTEKHELMERSPTYRELVRRRAILGWSLSGLMLVIYFGFILLVAFDKPLLAVPLGAGVTTIGIPIGLAVIASAFVLTGIYVRAANSVYDGLVRKLVEEAR
jgi:uncharacterized membrane protein (DUF485 family)